MIHDTGTTRRRLADHLGAGDGWTISESGLSLSRLGARESVFAVGNGYLGVRGTPEEGGAAEHPGVILNGFHETWPIVYPEDAFGMARTGQTTVNATDGSIIRLFVDDEPFDLTTACVLRSERELDLRTGVRRREVEFERARRPPAAALAAHGVARAPPLARSTCSTSASRSRSPPSCSTARCAPATTSSSASTPRTVAEFWTRSDVVVEGAPEVQPPSASTSPAAAGDRPQRGPRASPPRA